MTAPAVSPEAIAAALELLQKATLDRASARTGPTVRELWSKYKTAESTQIKSWNRSELCGREILAMFGERPALSITLADIDEWRASDRQRTTCRGSAPAAATRNRTLEVFRRMLNWAYRHDLIDRHPLGRVEFEAEPLPPETLLTDADIEKLMAVATPMLRTIVLVLFDTGMRRAEVLDLRWDQIDATAGCIRLSGSQTKNRLARRPHLTKRALEALLAHPKHPRSPYVFCRPDGDRYHPRYIYELYCEAVTKAELQASPGESINMHTLRHSFIAKARRLGIPERVVMRQTGHMTRDAFDRYGGAPDDAELAALAASMEAGTPTKKGQG